MYQLEKKSDKSSVALFLHLAFLIFYMLWGCCVLCVQVQGINVSSGGEVWPFLISLKIRNDDVHVTNENLSLLELELEFICWSVLVYCAHTFWSSEKMCFSTSLTEVKVQHILGQFLCVTVTESCSKYLLECLREEVKESTGRYVYCMLKCVRACVHACVCVCVRVGESVEWRREQGVGWWAKAWCLQVQSARESGIKLSHPHINYSAARIVRALACHSGRRQTWARRENENGEQGREGWRRRRGRWAERLMIWGMDGETVALHESRLRGETMVNERKWLFKLLWRWDTINAANFFHAPVAHIVLP